MGRRRIYLLEIDAVGYKGRSADFATVITVAHRCCEGVTGCLVSNLAAEAAAADDVGGRHGDCVYFLGSWGSAWFLLRGLLSCHVQMSQREGSSNTDSDFLGQ